MKTCLNFYVPIAVIILLCLELEAQEPLRPERAFRSPDGQFVVRCLDEYIEITNTAIGETYPRVGVLPSYTVNWTDDSKTIVVFEHLAGGSDAVLVHFDGEGWRVTRTGPPEDDYDHVGVVQATHESGVFRIAYRADVRKNTQVLYFLITFDVDLRTGEYKNKSVKRITYKAYVGLHPLGPK